LGTNDHTPTRRWFDGTDARRIAKHNPGPALQREEAIGIKDAPGAARRSSAGSGPVAGALPPSEPARTVTEVQLAGITGGATAAEDALLPARSRPLGSLIRVWQRGDVGAAERGVGLSRCRWIAYTGVPP